jgi:excisionase family DNA binding protein
MSTQLPPRPIDATLTVTKAARLLGVHPNTVRAWSDAGRLRFYRINPRGDRRYRLGDLQRFLAVAERGATAPPTASPASIGRRSADPGRTDPRLELVHLESDDTARHRRDLALSTRSRGEPFGQTTSRRISIASPRSSSDERPIPRLDLGAPRRTPRSVAVSVPAGATTPRLLDLPRGFGVLGQAIDFATKAPRSRPRRGARFLGRDREWQRSRHDHRLARRSRGDGDGHPRTRRCVGRAARRRGSRRAVRSRGP